MATILNVVKDIRGIERINRSLDGVNVVNFVAGHDVNHLAGYQFIAIVNADLLCIEDQRRVVRWLRSTTKF